MELSAAMRAELAWVRLVTQHSSETNLLCVPLALSVWSPCSRSCAACGKVYVAVTSLGHTFDDALQIWLPHYNLAHITNTGYCQTGLVACAHSVVNLADTFPHLSGVAQHHT